MSKPITEINDPRLVKALAHPMRVRIMAILERRSATPKELAVMLGVRLENVSYHVRILRDLGYIRLERKRMVRGAVEHRYAMNVRPRITANAWEQLPAIAREALDAASLDQIWEIVTRAAAQDKMARPESQLTRRHALLDEQGFVEMSQIISNASERLIEIERQAAKRLRTHTTPEVPTVYVAMLFDAPDDNSGDAKPRSRARNSTRRRRART
jgi:DNA-binding transcriptional ArsR family regulator